MRRLPDPLLKTQPWKVMSVFFPLDQVIQRIEKDGTVDSKGKQIVFKEDMKGGWYDLPAALRGVIEFHQLATEKYGLPVDVLAMTQLANKLEYGVPLTETDLQKVKAAIASCKSQAMNLRVSQAADLVKTVQIRMEIERRKAA